MKLSTLSLALIMLFMLSVTTVGSVGTARAQVSAKGVQQCDEPAHRTKKFCQCINRVAKEYWACRGTTFKGSPNEKWCQQARNKAEAKCCRSYLDKPGGQQGGLSLSETQSADK